MERVRSLRSWLGLVALLLCAAMPADASNLPAAGEQPRRADVIRIDGLRTFGKLERPAVIFLHDKHTEALAKQGKDCAACHQRDKEKDRLVPKFMRAKENSRQEVMGVYHDNCIACHNETLALGAKSGPVTCGQCHREKAPAVSSWRSIGMDRSLHFRHAKAQENKCERCHHEYNPQTKKLFYAKGQEGTCRYCHGTQTEENRVSMRLASHDGCIDCHSRTVLQKKTSGPRHCGGCHDPEAQAQIQKVQNLPRIERKQPDVLFVRQVAKDTPPPAPGTALSRLEAVPFDHKAHEGYNDTCRVCHHAAISACAECHPLEGDKKGKGVKLAEAMHRDKAGPSCVGCHAASQQQPQCAGCHAAISRARAADPAGCRACHMTPAAQAGSAPLSPEEETARAAAVLAGRTPMRASYDAADIPEKVVIKTLAKQYAPAEMPHRKVVAALVEKAAASPLAGYFHLEKGTICQGCHHNSPTSKQPPRCSHCHGQAFDADKPHVPGLLGAYHQQCLGCHEAMNLEKPKAVDCTACHKEKNG